MMKRFLTIIFPVLFMVLSFDAAAQEETYRDSLVYHQAATLDSTLRGKSIFAMLPSKAAGDRADVKVHQSQSIASAMQRHISANSSKAIQGYRVRIYFNNSKNARNESEKTVSEFSARYPGIPAYRSYQNPSFKVTVGDFRTRSEAMSAMLRFKNEYPSAFVVKENINYPAVDSRHTYDVDTVRVAMPRIL